MERLGPTSIVVLRPIALGIENIVALILSDLTKVTQGVSGRAGK